MGRSQKSYDYLPSCTVPQSERSHGRLAKIKQYGHKKYRKKNHDIGNSIDEINYIKYYPTQEHNKKYNIDKKVNFDGNSIEQVLKENTIPILLSNTYECKYKYKKIDCYYNEDYFTGTKGNPYYDVNHVINWNYKINCKGTLKENIVNKIYSLKEINKTIDKIKNIYPKSIIINFSDYCHSDYNYFTKSLKQINRRNEPRKFKSHNQKKLNRDKHIYFYT